MPTSRNPATGEVRRAFDELADAALEQRLARAAAAFERHRLTSFADRARRLVRAAELLEEEKHELGRLMTLEMGKPIGGGVSEAEKCAWVCRYYAEHGERMLADEVVSTERTRSAVAFQPLGVVLAVMPWNFPFWQVFRFAAPALMAGNVGLLKHASNVPECALAIEDVLRRAGFGGDEFQTLLIGSDRVGRVVADPRVAAATLTGSEPAGSAVAAAAGRVLKKTVLELGGSDPFIVMPSADIEAAARTAVTARVINSGQSCIAAKRFIVHEQVMDAFTARFVEGMEQLVVGDPLDARTQVGPLATAQILTDLERQVNESVERGARVLTGGARLPRPGYFYAPTVLVDVPPEAPACREELFGPVAPVLPARDVNDAVRIANDTPFGLGASVWTRDPAERARFVRDLQAGALFLNALVASDPRLPFGGIKRSGYGRELGTFGLREFVNIKTVVDA